MHWLDSPRSSRRAILQGECIRTIASLAHSWEVVKLLIEQGIDVKSDAGGAADTRSLIKQNTSTACTLKFLWSFFKSVKQTQTYCLCITVFFFMKNTGNGNGRTELLSACNMQK